MSNLVHLLGVFMIVAGSVALIVQCRRRPPTRPEPEPEPEPGSLFVKDALPRRTP